MTAILEVRGDHFIVKDRYGRVSVIRLDPINLMRWGLYDGRIELKGDDYHVIESDDSISSSFPLPKRTVSITFRGEKFDLEFDGRTGSPLRDFLEPLARITLAYLTEQDKNKLIRFPGFLNYTYYFTYGSSKDLARINLEDKYVKKPVESYLWFFLALHHIGLLSRVYRSEVHNYTRILRENGLYTIYLKHNWYPYVLDQRNYHDGSVVYKVLFISDRYDNALTVSADQQYKGTLNPYLALALMGKDEIGQPWIHYTPPEVEWSIEDMEKWLCNAEPEDKIIF